MQQQKSNTRTEKECCREIEPGNAIRYYDEFFCNKAIWNYNVIAQGNVSDDSTRVNHDVDFRLVIY